MIQGFTLPAAIADCGDTDIITGMTDMITAYVILSLVKSATGLLVLRAFARHLFRWCPPPGPTCLLPLLRSCFRRAQPTITSSAQGRCEIRTGVDPEQYTPAAAVADYEAQTNEYKRSKQILRVNGPTWQCCECKAHFPAEVFGANPKSSEEIRTLCIATIFWRRCTACTGASARRCPKLATTGHCSMCKRDRSAIFFPIVRHNAHHATYCNPCKSQCVQSVSGYGQHRSAF